MEGYSYKESVKRDIKEILLLINRGFKAEYSKNNNYIIINNTTFNGFTKERYEKIERSFLGKTQENI